MKTFKEPLTPKEEALLLSQLKTGNMEARNQLVERNMRLVAHIAKKYNSGERDFDDILSIGTIGLIKAVNTFDESKGNRLVTYASKCIENEILMHMRTEKKKTREVSLYEPIGTDKEGNAISLLDIMECETKDFAAEYDLNSQISWLVANISKVLTPFELNIIIKRYGLFGETEVTQRELAHELGISRSYVSRIEKKCLQKLKAAYKKASF
ncbi:MAG: RNA polymerase sporulation sigma factor SigK [Lachnospiraceae bacterium]